MILGVFSTFSEALMAEERKSGRILIRLHTDQYES